MRVLVLGGTWFVGRRAVERLYERGDQVLVVHRGNSEPPDWVPVRHLHTDRHDLGQHRQKIVDFAPDPELVCSRSSLPPGRMSNWSLSPTPCSQRIWR